MKFYQSTVDRWEPVRPGMDEADLDPVTKGYSDIYGVVDEVAQILTDCGEDASDYDVEAIAREVSGFWDSPLGLRWHFMVKFEDDFWEVVATYYEGE